MSLRAATKSKGSFRAEGNTLWLYDFIASDDLEAEWWGGVSPSQFIAALSEMSGPVTLRINSPGGSCFGGQAMVTAMREYPDLITAQVDSLAASAASVIAAGAGRCVIAPGAMIMIHKCWTCMCGNADEFVSEAAVMEKIDAQMAQTYAARSGVDEGWDELMSAETWFDADEAVQANLADEVMSGDTQRQAMAWDLSAYANAPELPTAPAEPEIEEPAADTLAADELAARRRQVAARLACNPV